MSKALKIRDLSLTLGNKLLLGGRLSNSSISTLLPAYRAAGFYAVDVWGEDVAEIQMEYNDESPWQRMRNCAEGIGESSLLSASINSRNPLPGTPLPNFILEKFFREAMKWGVSLINLSDPLNDIGNLEESSRLISDIGAVPDLTIYYSALTDDESDEEHPKKGLFSRIFGEPDEEEDRIEVYSDDYFISKAKELEELGAGIITLNDESGMLTPSVLYSLIPKLKHAVRVPLAIRVRNTSGKALACVITAIIKGIDIVDTSCWWCASSESTPPVELIRLFCDKMDIDGDLDMAGVDGIRHTFLSILKKSPNFPEIISMLPGDYDSLFERMPPEIDKEFDRAIMAATEDYESELLDACANIENYFGIDLPSFPSSRLPKEIINQIISGAGLLNLPTHSDENENISITDEPLNPAIEAFQLFKKIRKDAGQPPLVHPIDKALAAQALALVSDRINDLPDYSTTDKLFFSLIKGEMGHTPIEISPVFREKITGQREETPFDTLSYSEPSNPELPEYGDLLLARNDEEYLLLELSPDIATAFLKKLRKKEGETLIQES